MDILSPWMLGTDKQRTTVMVRGVDTKALWLWISINRIMDIHKSARITDIHNIIMDIHNIIMDIHNIIMDIHNIIMDIHKSILEILNSIMDIHNWIMDIHN